LLLQACQQMLRNILNLNDAARIKNMALRCVYAMDVIGKPSASWPLLNYQFRRHKAVNKCRTYPTNGLLQTQNIDKYIHIFH
jgi:hypothetical protein